MNGLLICFVRCRGRALLYETAQGKPFTVAVLAVAGCLWSWGMMHNYATEMAMKHSSYRAGFFDLTEREIQSVPNWVAAMNILFTLIAVGLLVTG